MKISKITNNNLSNLAEKTLKKMEEKPKVIIGKSGLPLEAPIEKDIFIFSQRECFESIKDRININIQNIKG